MCACNLGWTSWASPPGGEHHRREDREIRVAETCGHGIDFGIRYEPFGNRLVAHLSEGGGSESGARAAALAYRNMPLHADAGQAGGLEPSVEAARPFRFETALVQEPPQRADRLPEAFRVGCNPLPV